MNWKMKLEKNWERLGMSSEWKTVSASEYCLIVTDGTHDSPKQTNEGHYLVTSKHLSKYSIDFESAYLISSEDYSKVIERSKVDQWDILFSMIGTIGRLYQEKFPNPNYAIKNVGLFKLGGDIKKSNWLIYYLQSPNANQYILSHLRGSTQSYISLKSLRDMPVSIPPTSIQNKIVSILSSIDEKIELNNKINDNLEQMAQAIFKNQFVDFEPFKNGKFVESELGLIPEGWKVDMLENTCKFLSSGGTPSTKNSNYYAGDIKWFSTKELNDNFLINSEKHITLDAIANSSAKLFPKGTVLMAIYAAPTVGRLGILCDDSTFNQATVGLDVKENVGLYFIYLTLLNQREKLNNLANGAAQQNLNVSIVKKYKILVPNESILIDFNNLIKPIFSQIENLQLQNDQLKKKRDLLLPKLMSGETDVSQVEI